VSGPNALPLGGLNVEPIASAAQKIFSAVRLSPAQVIDVRHGKRIRLDAVESLGAGYDFGAAGLGGNRAAIGAVNLAAIGPGGELVAILTLASKTELKSLVVFADA